MDVKPLSGKDIKKFMNDECLILPYEDLKYYYNINDVFNTSNYVFLLYPISQNYGHWVLLMKYGNNIEFFDSYGIFTDMEYKYGVKKTPKYLSLLLINSNSKYKLYYNEKRYQEWNTNYCGYFCIVRALNSNKTLKQFQKILDNEKDVSNFVYMLLLDGQY
jgi:hypothetical protein